MKKIKIFFDYFFKKLPKCSFQTVIVSERDKKPALRKRKEVILKMELTSSQQQTIRHQFDSFCKKVLKNEARNCYDEAKSKCAKEVLFSEMSQDELDNLSSTDKYPSDLCRFIVHGFVVDIEDELLAEAISNLPQGNRDIILLSYFFDMNDKEIAEKLNIVRRTVQYRRTSTLSKIRKYMEGIHNEEE